MKDASPSKQKLARRVDEIRRLYKDKVYVTTLLRHTYRDNGKIKQKTLGVRGGWVLWRAALIVRVRGGER